MALVARSLAARLLPRITSSSFRSGSRPLLRSLTTASAPDAPPINRRTLKWMAAFAGLGVAAAVWKLSAGRPLLADGAGDVKVFMRSGAPAPDLDDPHVRLLRELFLKHASVQIDGSAYLSVDDFLKCLSQGVLGHDDTNIQINAKKFKKLFELADKGQKEVMSFAEFVNLDRMISLPHAEYLLAFRIADSDGNGYISKDEFLAVLQANIRDDAVPFNMDTDFVRLYFGKKGEGRLSFEEFTQLLKGLHQERIRQEFQYYDRDGSGYVSGEIFERIITDVGLFNRIPKHLQENLKAVENLAHRNGEKGVSYAHIVAFSNLLLHIPSYVRVFRAAQQQFHTDAVDKEQFLRAAHTATTIEITPMEAELIFHFFDVQKRGTVSLDNFARVIQEEKLRRENIKKLTSDKTTSSAGEVAAPAIVESAGDTAVKMLKESVIHFTLGAIAGGIGATAVYPIDLVKTRMQNQRTIDPAQRLYANSWDCFRKVLHNEGFRGLYKGLLPQLVGVAPEKAIKLTVNDLLRNLFGNREKYGDIYFPLEVLAGGGAGASQVIFTNPLEIVKIRLQVQGERLKSGVQLEKQGAVSLMRELGLAGLYKGAGACLLRDIPFSAIYFPLYANLKKKFENADGTISASRLLLAGTISGVPAAGLVTPADVIKTRLQVKARAGEQVYEGIRDCFWKVLQTEGPRAFWKGTLARVFRSSPQFGVTLLSYELLQQTLFPGIVPRPPTSAPVSQADIASAFGTRQVLSEVERVENKWFALFTASGGNNNNSANDSNDNNGNNA